MTPEAQRIAIAEARGIEVAPYRNFMEIPLGVKIKGTLYYNLPDYLNDMNAMQGAEQVLSDEQLGTFASLLIHSRIPCPDGTVADWDLWEEYGWPGLLKATAAQHAEAFLRTIGKWDDSK